MVIGFPVGESAPGDDPDSAGHAYGDRASSHCFVPAGHGVPVVSCDAGWPARPGGALLPYHPIMTSQQILDTVLMGDHPVLTYYPKLGRVRRYVQEHVSEPVALKDAALVACLQPRSFSAYFREKVGIRFAECVARVRVANAAGAHSRGRSFHHGVCACLRLWLSALPRALVQARPRMHPPRLQGLSGRGTNGLPNATRLVTERHGKMPGASG